MPIKGLTDRATLRPQLPRLGKLRKGGPKENGQFGEDLDHFRFTSDRAEVAESFKALYGEQPHIINVYLLHPSLEENFSTWIELWSEGGLQWRSNGEHQVLWLDDGHYKHGERPHADHPDQSEVGRLEFIVPELIRAGHIGTVTLETHANHDIRAIAGVLLAAEQEQEQKQNPLGLRGIPFVLRRVQEEIGVPGWGNNEGKRVRVKKWLVKLEPPPALAMLDMTLAEVQEPLTPLMPPTPPTTPATSTPDGLTEAQRAAFAHVTPGGKQLGKQSPEELGKMLDWANDNPDNAAAQTFKQHCEVLLDYLGQFEAHPEETDEDVF